MDDLVKRGSGSTELDVNTLHPLAGSVAEADPWDELRALARELAEGRFTGFNIIGMEFINILAGSFGMGSDLRKDEKPIHNVTIDEDFFMGRYPVTQSQWQQIMGSSLTDFTGDLYPVHSVSWNDAQEFIRRLNVKAASLDGDLGALEVHYRLPSEAEWEYACRAGLTGDVTADVYAMDIYGDSPRGQSIRPIEEKRPRPNAFGLYNMVVGFKEWCEDRYHVNYNGAPSDGSVWGEVAGEENRVPQMNRVARGSLSGSPPIYKRASARGWAAPWCRGVNFSFRLVAVEKSEARLRMGS